MPDGRYEIEYVLGDTFSRVILRFDVRNGEPVVPEDDLDEGELLLEKIPEQIESQSVKENQELKGKQEQEAGQEAEIDDQSLLQFKFDSDSEAKLNMSLELRELASWDPSR